MDPKQALLAGQDCAVVKQTRAVSNPLTVKLSLELQQQIAPEPLSQEVAEGLVALVVQSILLERRFNKVKPVVNRNTVTVTGLPAQLLLLHQLQLHLEFVVRNITLSVQETLVADSQILVALHPRTAKSFLDHQSPIVLGR